MSMDLSSGSFCRVCMEQPKDESLMPADEEFSVQIKRCTGLQLQKIEDWPNMLCTSCALLVRAALKLRTLCEKTEEQLQNWKLEKTLKENMELHDDLEELEELDCSDSNSDSKFECVPSYEVKFDDESVVESKRSREPIIVPVKRIRSPPKFERGFGLTYVCSVCSNVYTEKVKLTAHMKFHSEHKQHECEICHKRFRQTPQLARHMNSHTGQRPYKCDYCDACFADPSTRIKHQRIHTNERPYKCRYCSKSFSYSNVLNVHLKIHTGERPFSCQYCGRRFSQLHHKKTHEGSHKFNKNGDVLITLNTKMLE